MQNLFRLYVHLRVDDQIKDTITLDKIPDNQSIRYLREQIIKKLDQINVSIYILISIQDGNKIYTIQSISAHRLSDTGLSNKRKISSYFTNKSDVYCLIQITVDTTKHVKPISSEIEQNKQIQKSIALTNYSFFESSKSFVKVLVPFQGVGGALDRKNNLVVDFKKRKFMIDLIDVNGKNYHFGCGWLHHRIKPDECKVVIKENRVQIKLRKDKDDDHWFTLFKQKMVGEKLADYQDQQ